MVVGATSAYDKAAYFEKIIPLVQPGWCKTLLMEEVKGEQAQLQGVRDIQRAMVKGTKTLGDALWCLPDGHEGQPRRQKGAGETSL